MQQVVDHPLAGAPAEPLVDGRAGVPMAGSPPRELAYAPAPPPDVVESFLGRPAPAQQYTEQSVAQTAEGVLTLAKSGAWRAAASLSERLLAHSHPVDVLLQLRWYCTPHPHDDACACGGGS